MEHPIKTQRKKLGMTQTQLAKELEVNQTTVCKWESMKMSPTKEYEDKMAQLFGVSVDLLNGLEDEKDFSYSLYDAAFNMSSDYQALVSEYSNDDTFRRMVRIWRNLTDFQRMELIGFAQGIMGRVPDKEDIQNEGN